MPEEKKLEMLPGTHVFDGICYSRLFPQEILKKIKNKEFEFRSDDVIVSGYPKSGTTWTNEMVWLVANNCDFEGASENTETRIPILEQCLPQQTPAIEILENKTSPRTIATHLPTQFLVDQIKNSNTKVIHVVRNPKDMLVSSYHFMSVTLSKMIDLEWNDFFQVFQDKKMFFGDWFEHTLDWWKLNELDNVLILTYEDAKKDHKGTVEKIVKFLEKDLTDEQIQAIVDHTTISSMRKNPATNKSKVVDMLKSDKKEGEFIRKGKVGDWKTLISHEQNDFINQRYDHEMRNSGLHIEFE